MKYFALNLPEVVSRKGRVVPKRRGRKKTDMCECGHPLSMHKLGKCCTRMYKYTNIAAALSSLTTGTPSTQINMTAHVYDCPCIHFKAVKP